MKPEDRWFYRGMACAAAVLARRDEPTLAVECLESNGVTLDMLRQARVEPFDLGPLAKAWRSERPKRPTPEPAPAAPGTHDEEERCRKCGRTMRSERIARTFCEKGGRCDPVAAPETERKETDDA